jgi:hypothetical protein
MQIALQSVLAVVTLFSGLSLMAQEKTKIISGTVTSFDEASPLEGVTITVKGKKDITGTMLDGTFSLPLVEKDTVITASLTGYQSREIRIGSQLFYEIVLKKIDNVPVPGIPLNKIQ